MRYITEIRLENFQNHSDTTIHLTEGLNLLIGSSDAGKSAVLRALNFVFYNQPRGTRFIQKHKEEAIVTLKWSDGSYCQRIKGESRNVIVYQKSDQESPTMLDKPNKDLPKEFMEFLGNPHYDKLNGGLVYAAQKEKLFLVGLTDTELPRAISELTGIADIERAAKTLASRNKANDKEVKKLTAKAVEIKDELINLPDTDKALKRAEICESLVKQIESIDDQIESIESILEAYSNLSILGVQAQKSLEQAKKVVGLESEVKKINNLVQEMAEIDELTEEYDELMDTYLSINQKLEAAESIYDKNLLNDIKRYSQIEKKFESITHIINDYETLQKEYMQLTELIQKLQNTIKINTDMRNELITVMIENKMFCTQCNQIISEVIE